MQGPDSTDSSGSAPIESEEILKLQAEITRLMDKRAQSDDADIVAALDSRIKELEVSLAPQPVGAETSEPEEAEEPAESEETQKLRLELGKLQDKLSKTKDPNIISVLQMRISQIEPFLPPPPKPKSKPSPTSKELEAEEEEAFAKIPLPSPIQTQQAEQLIRQSMLEKRRGNAVGATDLLKKAVEAAPGSAVVLEALADDLAERKLTKQARETYKRALRQDPKNVGLERKFAMLVLQSTTTMSVENQLRYGVSDSLLITGDDNVAGLTAAKFFSAFIPGCGQLVIGRTTKGAILLGLWIVCVGMFALWNKDFLILAKSIRGIGPSPNARVFIPLIGMTAVWITSMADLFSGQSKTVSRHSKVERPKPPVDLPFD